MDKFFQIGEVSNFISENKQRFEDALLHEAANVRDRIDDILKFGNIDLVNNAHKLVGFILEGKNEELRLFAKQEGIAWASHELTLSFKLEWVQAIRRTLWAFIQENNKAAKEIALDDFFLFEKQINNGVDAFLNAFFINFSTYKDALIKSQRELVENLSVPIIPISPTICILPLIGTVDTFRTNVMEEKVLQEIGKLRIQTLILDLSGIAEMDNEVIDHLLKIIDGSSMMGCRTVITGLRAEVVRKMIHLGFRFGKDTETFGSLQQALNKHISYLELDIKSNF
ncbi:STAS domain-containing protein [Peribacillus glennii]|uniref:STAS domain-containing protein n=2 Tax=Peribacillus glennii TaxID=2303991 RepID=A0A372LFF4_9BACI|nr:STAS domain-containing protein [Peribacillus glennii]RFU64692.1 STAS domain-containing protein [Peribacillus glennii]